MSILQSMAVYSDKNFYLFCVAFNATAQHTQAGAFDK